jgi:hypothetical protein
MIRNYNESYNIDTVIVSRENTYFYAHSPPHTQLVDFQLASRNSGRQQGRAHFFAMCKPNPYLS